MSALQRSITAIKSASSTRDDSDLEEIGNVLSHGIGAILSLIALILMIELSAPTAKTTHLISYIVYGTSLLTVYLSSTFYHLAKDPHWKEIFNFLDHSSIYILIAGTYTPITIAGMDSSWGWTLFALIWTIAIAGIIFKIFFLNRFRFFSTMIYIGMGWVFIFALKPILESLPLSLIIWILIGGFFYTAGTFFYLWKKIPFSHTIWHIFVLLGSVSHFFGIYLNLV